MPKVFESHITPPKTVFIPTTYVDLDEAALDLVETVRKTPDQHERHRYQEVHVIRIINGDHRRAVYTRDLGVSHLAKEKAIHILAGGQEANGKFWSVHTVGEVLEMAKQMRETRVDLTDMVMAPSNRRKQALARMGTK